MAGNWKMNLGPKATREFGVAIQALLKTEPKTASTLLASQSNPMTNATTNAETKSVSKLMSVLFVSDVSLTDALKAFAGTGIEVGAQNVHWEDQGAFTGEISPPMIKELGIEWTLVGHSERRQYFGETDETVKKRAQSHLKHGLKVVLCIGETKAEREAAKTETVIERQLKNGLPDLPNERLFIAYEPVWAIGTGLTATPEQAEEAHAFVRKCLTERYGKEFAAKMLILYGGSVTPENVSGLLSKPNVDGGLVGGASVKPASYLSLLQAGTNAL